MADLKNEVNNAVVANADQPLYEVTVPYNNPVLVAARKKSRLAVGIVCLIGTLLDAAIAIGAWVTNEGGDMTIITIMMAALGVAFLACTVWNFTHLKASDRDNNKDVQLTFFAESLKVIRNDQGTGKNKSLENCLYRAYKSKQYVAKIYDYENRLEIKIRTGSYNGAPTYSVQTLPKDVLDATQASALLAFLQEKVGKDYVRK